MIFEIPEVKVIGKEGENETFTIVRTLRKDQSVSVKPGLHIRRKDRKHRLENMFFFKLWLGLHMVEMITDIDLSQEIFAINVPRTLKSSLKHRCKHVLWSLQLYGYQAEVV